jgi:hypothetical protein
MAIYSKGRRREVLAACDAGEGTRAVALRFGCSESWGEIREWMGHRDSKIIELYRHLRREDATRKMQRTHGQLGPDGLWRRGGVAVPGMVDPR